MARALPLRATGSTQDAYRNRTGVEPGHGPHESALRILWPEMGSRARITLILATLMLALAVVGCDDGGSEPGAPSRPTPSNGSAADDTSQSRAATVGCEGITPRPDWRSQTTAVGNFGLFVRHLASQATKLSNDNYLVKAGAAVKGDEPVTLRVPDSVREIVGLVYGDASRGRQRQPSTALTQVTFRPCVGKPRSGYVGGLIFGGKPRVVTLEVLSNGTTEPLRLRP